jgi:hypothetical protein
MRLAQLARKVGRTQSDIVTFLAINKVTILEESNTRIEEAHALLVTQHFAPALLNTLVKIEEHLEEAEIPTSENLIEPTSKIEISETPFHIENATVEQVEPEATIELIKAPKIELQGLKVIGKIDLPETKKKQVEETKEIKTQPNLSRNRVANIERKPYKNPIELKREREAEEKELRIKEQAAYQKEIRTQRYLTKVRKPTDIYMEPKERIHAVSVSRAEQKKTVRSTSIISRLLRWMAGK